MSAFKSKFGRALKGIFYRHMEFPALVAFHAFVGILFMVLVFSCTTFLLVSCTAEQKRIIDKYDPPYCPPENPNCGCVDEKHHTGCADDPTDPRDPLLFGDKKKPRDGGAASDSGVDSDKKD